MGPIGQEAILMHWSTTASLDTSVIVYFQDLESFTYLFVAKTPFRKLQMQSKQKSLKFSVKENINFEFVTFYDY